MLEVQLWEPEIDTKDAKLKKMHPLHLKEILKILFQTDKAHFFQVPLHYEAIQMYTKPFAQGVNIKALQVSARKTSRLINRCTTLRNGLFEPYS